jgi:hypothetical protein
LIEAFSDGLKANGVDIKKPAPEVLAFFKEVNKGGGAGNGQSATFLVVKNADGTDTVTYESGSGFVSAPVVGPAGFGKTILSLWLGNINPGDTGLQRTKADLLKF